MQLQSFTHGPEQVFSAVHQCLPFRCVVGQLIADKHGDLLAVVGDGNVVDRFVIALGIVVGSRLGRGKELEGHQLLHNDGDVQLEGSRAASGVGEGNGEQSKPVARIVVLAGFYPEALVAAHCFQGICFR